MKGEGEGKKKGRTLMDVYFQGYFSVREDF